MSIIYKIRFQDEQNAPTDAFCSNNMDTCLSAFQSFRQELQRLGSVHRANDFEIQFMRGGSVPCRYFLAMESV